MAVNELIEESPTKPQRLYNVTCAYCGLALTKDNTTKEHVVGRRFVPKGTLENEWNLILNACASCNNRKAELENDISAISMQPDVRGKHFSDHPQLAADAAHKGQRAHSRYTGKLIADSKTEMQINYEFAPGVTISFNMVGQPAVDERRLFELALRHFQAFFYLVTYDEQEKRGKFWRGSYLAIQAVSKNDWGNDVARAFMEQTRAWKTHVQAITAHGHFKVAIRQDPINDMWSLAVEWNQNYRVIAVGGAVEAVQAFASTLPKLKMDSISETSDSYARIRTEQALGSEDDILFHVDEQAAARSV